jgi:DNA (cytosine-5)-methyltransferase 1
MEPSEGETFVSAGYTRGFWKGCDWWHGRDEKFRPIEPGVQPLATGISKRVGKLRGYGNSIVPEIAAEFITAHMAWSEKNLRLFDLFS